MNKKWLFLSALVFVLTASAAHAQDGDAGSGCDTSPENPTLILALVGSAGTAGAMLRERFKARAKKP